jgi:hypothetical protein
MQLTRQDCVGRFGGYRMGKRHGLPATALLHSGLRQEVRARLERPEQHWKFSAADVAKRAYWDQYVAAYEDVLNATSMAWAPRRRTGSWSQW